MIAFAKEIPDELVFHKIENGKEDAGIELKPHITIEYGIHTQDESKIKSILMDQRGGTVSLGKLNIFSQDECDVLKIPVTGRSMHRLHKLLSKKLNIKEKYPDYYPHMTIAYMKKG
ncbi:MAG: hypothetical protein WC375_10055, partial [Methanomassiliicoccales archaeon]